HDLAAAFREVVVELIAASSSPVRTSRVQRIRRVAELVRRTGREPISLARAAKEAGLSPSHFSRVFRQEQGVGFATFVQRERLRRAKELLVATSLPLYRVAAEAGFRSYLHFERAFRRQEKQKPSEYRARRQRR